MTRTISLFFCVIGQTTSRIRLTKDSRRLDSWVSRLPYNCSSRSLSLNTSSIVFCFFIQTDPLWFLSSMTVGNMILSSNLFFSVIGWMNLSQIQWFANGSWKLDSYFTFILYNCYFEALIHSPSSSVPLNEVIHLWFLRSMAIGNLIITFTPFFLLLKKRIFLELFWPILARD